MFARAVARLLVLAGPARAAWGQDRVPVVLGDSPSSGYGSGAAPSWLDLLQDELHAQRFGYVVVNAGLSGETSAGGLARLPDLLASQAPSIVGSATRTLPQGER